MSKTTLSWKQAEQIAAMVESALSPDAKVEHNVRLPVLGSKRHRQCDVVVTYGSGPRKSIAIVEVQKRKRKPDITTFHGWHRKMQEVGAQQLFCVSAAGFPQSITDEVASKIGPTVTLLTMSDATVCRRGGFYFWPVATNITPKFSIRNVGEMKVRGLSEPHGSKTTSDKCLSIGKESTLMNLNELLSVVLGKLAPVPNTPPHEPPPPSHDIQLEITDKDDCWLLDSSERHQIVSWSIEIHIEYVRTQHNIFVRNLEYRQELVEGALAWIAKATIPNGSQTIELTIVAVPGADGLWSFRIF